MISAITVGLVTDDEASYRIRLGAVITELRLKRGMKRQDALAQELGVSASTVQRWETGKTQPSAWDVRALATALSVDCGLLVDPPDRLPVDVLDASHAVGVSAHREMVKRAARRLAGQDGRKRE